MFSFISSPPAASLLPLARAQTPPPQVSLATGIHGPTARLSGLFQHLQKENKHTRWSNLSSHHGKKYTAHCVFFCVFCGWVCPSLRQHSSRMTLSHLAGWWRPDPSSSQSAGGKAPAARSPPRTGRTAPPGGPPRPVHSSSSRTEPTARCMKKQQQHLSSHLQTLSGDEVRWFDSSRQSPSFSFGRMKLFKFMTTARTCRSKTRLAGDLYDAWRSKEHHHPCPQGGARINTTLKLI